MIHPSIFNTTPNHAARWHDRSVSSLSARTIYCSQTASDHKTTNKYYLLPYGTIKHCKCMQSFFSPFFTFTYKAPSFFFFFSLEEPLFFIFILEPLVFRCSKCRNIFSPQIKCEVLTSSKKIKHTRRILLIVPSWHQKATTLRTAEDAMFVCCGSLGSLWVIVCSSYLFRFLEVWETAKNEPQKTKYRTGGFNIPYNLSPPFFGVCIFHKLLFLGHQAHFAVFVNKISFQTIQNG